MRRSLWIIVALLLGLWLWSGLHAPSPPAVSSGIEARSVSTSLPALPEPAPARGNASPYPAFLPPEAHGVLQRIDRGGPFEYRQDGGVFQNREQRLPRQPRGYYREYTVETPRSDDRGARRIVTGGDPPSEYYYTGDHYTTFHKIRE